MDFCPFLFPVGKKDRYVMCIENKLAFQEGVELVESFKESF